ncbi:MAG TPA: hypothetical protein VIM73_22850 [Polyangiaceae bacterium]
MIAKKRDGSDAGDAEYSKTHPNQSDFPTTSWTFVRAGTNADPTRARTALMELAKRYERPLRAYLSTCGYTDAEAEELTQRFLEELVAVDAPHRGGNNDEPFRVWLLRALELFLSSNPDPTPGARL